MPELPEVETIRSDLKSSILNKKIQKIEILDDKVIGKDSKKGYFSLKGLKITAIERQGKLLAFLLSNNKYLLTHLKMTGQLVLKDNKDIRFKLGLKECVSKGLLEPFYVTKEKKDHLIVRTGFTVILRESTNENKNGQILISARSLNSEIKKFHQ
jgi:formamidopyrimidine-DNA glycosylase